MKIKLNFFLGVSLFFVALPAFAGTEVFDLVDDSTNQPTWLDASGGNWGIFPVPGSPLTCDLDWVTNCPATNAVSGSDNVMKRFKNPNPTDPFPAGTYYIVKEAGTQCSSGTSFATCSGYTSNNWQQFTISAPAPTSTASTTLEQSIIEYYSSENIKISQWIFIKSLLLVLFVACAFGLLLYKFFKK